MGGVLADATPMTMPSLPNILNRFSRLLNVESSSLSITVFDRVWNSATMNQLYHPRRTASFFAVLEKNSKIPVFTITNNVVHDLTTFADQEKKQKTLEGVESFLKSNGYEFCLNHNLQFLHLRKK